MARHKCPDAYISIYIYATPGYCPEANHKSLTLKRGKTLKIKYCSHRHVSICSYDEKGRSVTLHKVKLQQTEKV